MGEKRETLVKREKLGNGGHARKSNDLTSSSSRSLESHSFQLPSSSLLSSSFIHCRSALFLSLSFSNCPDEPVNPRGGEGESSPVNAQVMTRVATLKNPPDESPLPLTPPPATPQYNSLAWGWTTHACSPCQSWPAGRACFLLKNKITAPKLAFRNDPRGNFEEVLNRSSGLFFEINFSSPS